MTRNIIGSPPWGDSDTCIENGPEWLVTQGELDDYLRANGAVRRGESLRILVTGSRDWLDKSSIRKSMLRALKLLSIKPENAVLIHGAAKGADSLAAEIALDLGMNIEAHPANWSEHNNNCFEDDPGNGRCWRGNRDRSGRNYCKRAGFRRNQEMLDSGADVLLAFIRNGSKGASGLLDLWGRDSRPLIICRQSGEGPISGKIIGFNPS